ncbi:MAG: peptidoglycan DD-metalloendopeptidase family protein [Acidimicrobiales bacterium]
MANTIRIRYVADTADLKRGTRDAELQVQGLQGAFGGLARQGALLAGGFLGAQGVVSAITGSVRAAQEAEQSAVRLKTQLGALGISYDDNRQRIDDVIQAQSRLAALDDEELADSFTTIVRVTGDVNEALELNALAADIARGRNMDLAAAGEIVAKVAAGNTGILSRYGIQIEKGASATEALAELQAKFAGQAEAYGESNAGAADRARVAWENAQEQLGERLLPVITRLADFATDTLIPAISSFAGTVDDVVKKIGGWEEAAKFLFVAFSVTKITTLARSLRTTLIPALVETGAATGAAAAGSAAGRGGGGFLGAFKRVLTNPTVGLVVAFEAGRLVAKKVLGEAGTDAGHEFVVSAVEEINRNWKLLEDKQALDSSIAKLAVKIGAPGSKSEQAVRYMGRTLATATWDAYTDVLSQYSVANAVFGGSGGSGTTGGLPGSSDFSNIVPDGAVVNPVVGGGSIIGTPGAGTHNQSDWQSRNAIDIAAVTGTAVVAVESGRIVRVSGRDPDLGDVRTGSGKVLFGFGVTLAGNSGTSYYYGHLDNVRVAPGDQVRAGDTIGFIAHWRGGSAHVHFATSSGDPMKFGGGGATVVPSPTTTAPPSTSSGPSGTSSTSSGGRTRPPVDPFAGIRGISDRFDAKIDRLDETGETLGPDGQIVKSSVRIARNIRRLRKLRKQAREEVVRLTNRITAINKSIGYLARIRTAKNKASIDREIRELKAKRVALRAERAEMVEIWERIGDTIRSLTDALAEDEKDEGGEDDGGNTAPTDEDGGVVSTPTEGEFNPTAAATDESVQQHIRRLEVEANAGRYSNAFLGALGIGISPAGNVIVGGNGMAPPGIDGRRMDGGPVIVFQTAFPPTEAMARDAAAGVAQGLSSAGTRQSPMVLTGV